MMNNAWWYFLSIIVSLGYLGNIFRNTFVLLQENDQNFGDEMLEHCYWQGGKWPYTQEQIEDRICKSKWDNVWIEFSSVQIFEFVDGAS